MIPAIDVPSAISSTSVSNHHIKEEEFEEKDKEIENIRLSEINLPRLVEKSVIIHRDENGFGLRIKGQAPVFVEHVHENGAAWRAGVRKSDRISKVNGSPVNNINHKDVVLMFKSCTRFVGLTLVSSVGEVEAQHYHNRHPSLYSRNSLIGSMPTNELSSSHDISKGTALSQWRLSEKFMLSDQASNKSSRTAHNKPMAAGKQQHPFPTDNQHFESSNMSKFTNGSTYNNPAFSMPGRPTSTHRQLIYTKQLGDYHQQIVAPRRSESVSIRPRYLDTNQVTTPSLQQQQQQTRRISAIEAGEIKGDTDRHSDKRMAVCINCRALIDRQEQLPPGLTCLRCELKFGSASKLEKIRRAADQKHLDNQCQRIYSSLRDPRQAQAKIGESDYHNQTEHIYVDNNSANNDLPSLNAAKQPYYKLSQSASTSSLPAETNSNNLSATPNIVLIRQPTTNKRLEIIREFIDTEKTHTDRLRYLDELFYRPLKMDGLITAEQLRMVFSCHRTLYKIHRQIYRTLLSANYNLYAEPMIGSALLEIFEGDLKRRLERAACTFCASQSTNVELLNKLTRRDTKVGEFLAQVTSQQMVGRLGIKDLLASCFQRLTKYPLLLENLLKATPQSPSSIECDANKKNSRRECVNNNDDDDDNDDDEGGEDERPDGGLDDEIEEVQNSRRMLAISLAEEREFIERALYQSRQILIRVNESVKVAISHNKLKEIWKRTDKYPGVPLIDITKQQVVHEGLLTLRLSKRSFDVYVLLLNDYIIILTREGQDKYRLKFFTPEGKSSTNSQSVYSPVFVIDEHLTTRDAATDENGFYLLCKRKDDSRIYEFASRSPAERLKWRDRIQWTIEHQMSKGDRRPSCDSALTKSSPEILAKQETNESVDMIVPSTTAATNQSQSSTGDETSKEIADSTNTPDSTNKSADKNSTEPTKIEGTISYVEDDEIVMPSKMESSRALVDQAIQVNIFDKLRKPVSSN